MTASPSTFRWGLAILGGVLVELGLLVVLIVSYAFGMAIPLYTIPPASLVVTCAAAAWVARRASSRFILHGLAVGAVAALIYIVLTIGQTVPLAYQATHFLKIMGGIAGGYLVYRMRDRGGQPNISH